MQINIETKDAAVAEGNRVALQRLLGAARSSLLQRCPDVTRVHVLVNSGDQSIHATQLRAENRWRVEEDVRGECDLLAAHPDDPARRAKGVTDAQIDATLVVFACEAAHLEDPSDAVTKFQFARSLWMAGLYDEAVPHLAGAAQVQYAAANAFLGDAYWNGLGGVEEDAETAFAFYSEAASRGFAPAQAFANEIRQEILGECDALAAHPSDPQKQSAGVADAQVLVPAAIEACGAAQRIAPSELRIMFQLGRALWLGRQFEEALPRLIQAAERQYPPAVAYVGDALANGIGVERDLVQAAEFYKTASEAGFAPAKQAWTTVQAQLPPPPPPLRLRCDVQVVSWSANRSDYNVANTNFFFTIDFSNMNARTSTEQIASFGAPAGSDLVNASGLGGFNTRRYNVTDDERSLAIINVSDRSLEIESNAFGADPNVRRWTINLEDGAIRNHQNIVLGNVFGFPLRTWIEADGWCQNAAPPAAPRTAPRAAQRRAAR